MEAFVQKHKRADLLALQMAELKEQRDKLKNEKRKVQKEMKNEIKRQRSKSKAKKVNADELVQVLALRAQGGNKQAQKVKDTDKKKTSSAKVEE